MELLTGCGPWGSTCGSVVLPPNFNGNILDAVQEHVDQAIEGLDGISGVDYWGIPSTLGDHFARHGADFGAVSADDYAQQAADFLRQSQIRGLPTKVDSDGVIRIWDPATDAFGAYNSDGTTRTYYKPDPLKHGYASNQDYFLSQRGVQI